MRNNRDYRLRRGMLRMLYLGRRSRSGELQRYLEHIDVTVSPHAIDPADARNRDAVSRLFDPLLPPTATDEDVGEVLAGLKMEQLVVTGQDLHFSTGDASDVPAECWPWLSQHATYQFTLLD